MPPASEETALAGLVDIIRARGIKRLYCDRWPANAVYRLTRGAVPTSLNPFVFGDCSLIVSSTINLTPQTALLVREENVPLCQQVLAEHRIAMRQTTVAPWVLFDFEPHRWKAEYKENHGLHWAGFTCLTKNSFAGAAELIRGTACRPDPNKEIRVNIQFDNGIVFRGMSLSTNIVLAGDTFTIKYFWKYPQSGVKGRPCVFVHFLCGQNILQDDHLLEKSEGSEDQPYPELLVETRRLVLPRNACEGEYKIRIGLYDASRKDQRRIGVKTTLANQLNAVALPIKLSVTRNK